MVSAIPLSSYFVRSPSGNASTVSGKPPKPSIHYHASLGKDLGAIKLLRLHYPALSTHQSVQELGDGLYRAFQKEPVWMGRGSVHALSIIMGHGSPGYVEVGAGQFGYSHTRSISLDNEGLWAPQFARLWAPPWLPSSGPWRGSRAYRSIYFLSCSTAGSTPNGHVGRELMQRIADIGNLHVKAHTGLVYVNKRSIWGERGSYLPWCVPSDSPTGRCPEFYWTEPHTAAKQVTHKEFVSMKNIGFDAGMEIEDVESITIFNPRSGVERNFPSEIAPALFKTLFYSQPYTKDGGIIGALTARCIIKYRSQPSITVDILTDRLAEIQSGMVFLTSPNTRAILEQLEKG